MLGHHFPAKVLEDRDRLWDDLGVESPRQDQVGRRRVVLGRSEGQDLRIVLAKRETGAQLAKGRQRCVGRSKSRSEDLHGSSVPLGGCRE
jgi:hypothetical protein